MPLVTMPNIELVARDYLAGLAEVTDLVDEADIGSVLAKGRPSPEHPAIRIVRVGGTPRPGRGHWVDYPRVQLEAWAQLKNTAYDIAVTAMAAFVDAPNHPHDLAVVANVAVIVGPQDIPDPTFKPAMHRWIFDSRWAVHPHPSEGDT